MANPMIVPHRGKDRPQLKCTIPPHKALYVHLNEPQYWKDKKVGKYQIVLRMTLEAWQPYQDAIRELVKEARELVIPPQRLNMRQNGVPVPVPWATMPWSPSKDKEEDGEIINFVPVPGFVDVHFSSSEGYNTKEQVGKPSRFVARRPQVVDRFGNNVKMDGPEAVLVGRGTELLVGTIIRPWYQSDEVGYGVSLQIEAVQLINVVAPGGGLDAMTNFAFNVADGAPTHDATGGASSGKDGGGDFGLSQAAGAPDTAAWNPMDQPGDAPEAQQPAAEEQQQLDSQVPQDVPEDDVPF